MDRFGARWGAGRVSEGSIGGWFEVMFSHGQGGSMAAVETLFHRQSTDDRWMDTAACKGLTHLFFPSPAERPQARERREAMAKAVCVSCTVKSSCREFARTNHEYGFWGGESEDERHEAGFRLIAPIGVRARDAV